VAQEVRKTHLASFHRRTPKLTNRVRGSRYELANPGEPGVGEGYPHLKPIAIELPHWIFEKILLSCKEARR
jgi:hypothetical protein